MTHELNQQELKLEPDFKAALPVTVTDDDGEGGDIAGISVEAWMKLVKTICEWCFLLIYGQMQINNWVNIDALANDIGKPNFHHYLYGFLHNQLKLDPTQSSPFF